MPATRQQHENPERPQFLSQSHHSFIETVLFEVFDQPRREGYVEVLLRFNYGPHATSTGKFHLDIYVGSTRTRRATRKLASPLAPTRTLAIEQVDSFRLPDTAQEALVTSIRGFDPDTQQSPGWPHPDSIPAADFIDDPHPTCDPTFLDDHPNLEVTEDDAIGDYQLAGPKMDGVAVHRPAWKHLDIDATEREFGITGDGVDTAAVSAVSVDGEPYDKATNPAVSGWFRRFYPNATVTVDGTGTHITTEDGREWLPQDLR